MMARIWSYVISLFCLILFINGCAAFKAGRPPKGEEYGPEGPYGCRPPPADVFTASDLDLEFAESTFNKIVTGNLTIKSKPEVISLASKAMLDERIRNYLRCLAIMRDGYTKEQAVYFDQLAAFVTTKPTAQQFIDWQKQNRFPAAGGGSVLPSPKPKPTVASRRSWPGELDMFDGSDTSWYVGSTAPDENVEKWEQRIVGGRYRWDMVFSESWLKYILSPHGSAADFFAAVDVVFSAQSGEYVAAGLIFGHVGDVSSENPEHYDLHISSNGEWGLSYAHGLSNDWLRGPSKPSGVAIDIQQPVRISVLVEDGYMRFFVNGVPVGDWRESNFNGGDVGLFVTSNAGSVVVEFDEFELRRKPRL